MLFPRITYSVHLKPIRKKKEESLSPANDIQAVRLEPLSKSRVSISSFEMEEQLCSLLSDEIYIANTYQCKQPTTNQAFHIRQRNQGNMEPCCWLHAPLDQWTFSNSSQTDETQQDVPTARSNCKENVLHILQSQADPLRHIPLSASCKTTWDIGPRNNKKKVCE